MNVRLRTEASTTHEIVGLLEGVILNAVDLCRIDCVCFTQLEHAMDRRLARNRGVVALQGEPVEGVELHALPIDADRLPEYLSQAMRSFDNISRARHAARRQQDSMETSQCQLRRREPPPLQDRRCWRPTQ